mgnify:CR=1 FL=1
MADANETAASMIVGEGVLAKGTFQVPGRAVINGSIEGELIAKDILVGPTGRGVGKFTAETGDIRGEIHDTLVTTKSLIVRSTGRVSASVYYREVEIEKGGEIALHMFLVIALMGAQLAAMALIKLRFMFFSLGFQRLTTLTLAMSGSFSSSATTAAGGALSRLRTVKACPVLPKTLSASFAPFSRRVARD